jgi:L-ascorbate metabolism protein UlaG (beta-lactamase superfamily)
VVPCHYNTFPPIETDVQAFKQDVEQRTGGRTTVEVLDPGATLSL